MGSVPAGTLGRPYRARPAASRGRWDATDTDAAGPSWMWPEPGTRGTLSAQVTSPQLTSTNTGFE